VSDLIRVGWHRLGNIQYTLAFRVELSQRIRSAQARMRDRDDDDWRIVTRRESWIVPTDHDASKVATIERNVP
jgi:hypothetical protein